MPTYEVEVKSLLGGAERAETLRKAMQKLDPTCQLLAVSRQLNHYFEPSASHSEEKSPLERLAEKASPYLSPADFTALSELAKSATATSIRTRLSEKDSGKNVLLVVKATVGDDTSDNGVARREFEEKMPLSLQELDDLVMSAGFAYQAKWSRQREEYVCRGVNVTLDKNAGYGWLAEFERIVNDPRQVDAAEAEVRALMRQLDAVELPQERLERMFAHYNAHWEDYYGTEEIFVIE